MKDKFFFDLCGRHVTLNSDVVQDGWFGPIPVIKVFWSPFADNFVNELDNTEFHHKDWAVVYVPSLNHEDIYDYEYLWIIRSEHKTVLANYLNIDEDKLFINFNQQQEVIHA